MPGIDDLAAILPETAEVDARGHLMLGGCDTVTLAGEFGTPLYVYDEATLRNKCRDYCREFGRRYPDVRVVYACKAFICRALAQIWKEEGLGLDVVSGGELHIATTVGFDMSKVYFHGNNKSRDELAYALGCGIGRIVVDNFHELAMADEVSREAGLVQEIMLRLAPGIDPHTHQHTTTGVVDSKFGFPISTGQAEEALIQAMSASHLDLVGLHVHLGSPVFEVGPYQQAVDVVLRFAAKMRERHGFRLREFSPGGGFAVQYVQDIPAPPVSEYAQAIASALEDSVREFKMPHPRLVVEPGRSLVGRAGVALYRTGAVKAIPGVRKYVSLDGGMADNIRPALYGAKYEAVLANKMHVETSEPVSLAGKFCESGDILVRDMPLPPIEAGDIVAVPAAGAYCLAMSSNYNAALKPAVVLVSNGRALLIQRRETFDDLARRDLVRSQVG